MILILFNMNQINCNNYFHGTSKNERAFAKSLIEKLILIFQKNEFLLDEESEELFGGLSPFPPVYGAETTCSSVAGVIMPKILPMGRYGSVPAELPKSYKLDSPLVLKREGSLY